jgi:hypothetical protein
MMIRNNSGHGGKTENHTSALCGDGGQDPTRIPQRKNRLQGFRYFFTNVAPDFVFEFSGGPFVFRLKKQYKLKQF